MLLNGLNENLMFVANRDPELFCQTPKDIPVYDVSNQSSEERKRSDFEHHVLCIGKYEQQHDKACKYKQSKCYAIAHDVFS